MFRTTPYTMLENAQVVHVGHQRVVSYFLDEPTEHERERLINHALETRDTPVVVVETESGLFFRFLVNEVITFGDEAEDSARVYDTLGEEDVFVTATTVTHTPWQG